MQPQAVHRLRDLYIQLAKEIILNAIYQPGPHLTEGREWPPGDAFTMIGRKRLDNLEQRGLATIPNARNSTCI